MASSVVLGSRLHLSRITTTAVTLMEQGGNLYQPVVAENTFDKYTNVVYTAMRGGQDTIVTARKAIKISNDQAIELLANYGLSYWSAFAVNNHVRLGHDSVLVKGIFTI